MGEEAELAGIMGSNPCLLAGSEVKFSYNRKDFTSWGSGHAANCTKLVERLLHRDLPCEGDAHGGCSFNGVWAGPGFKRVIASSFFFDRLKDVGLVAKGSSQALSTPGSFLEEAAKACGKTLG